MVVVGDPGHVRDPGGHVPGIVRDVQPHVRDAQNLGTGDVGLGLDVVLGPGLVDLARGACDRASPAPSRDRDTPGKTKRGVGRGTNPVTVLGVGNRAGKGPRNVIVPNHVTKREIGLVIRTGRDLEIDHVTKRGTGLVTKKRKDLDPVKRIEFDHQRDVPRMRTRNVHGIRIRTKIRNVKRRRRRTTGKAVSMKSVPVWIRSVRDLLPGDGTGRGRRIGNVETRGDPGRGVVGNGRLPRAVRGDVPGHVAGSVVRTKRIGKTKRRDRCRDRERHVRPTARRRVTVPRR